MQSLKKHLTPALITALTTLVVLVATKPFADIFDSLLKVIAVHEEKLLLLRLLVSLLILLLAMLSYIIYLHKKFHYKKRFRFGVYWKEHTPFCPHCGGKLVKTAFGHLQCSMCEENLRLPFGGETSIKLERAIEELKKDGQ